MTSTPFTPGVTDAEEHPDVVEISALMEGVAAPERAAKLRTHLSSCDLCADVRTSLEDIRNTLGTLPGPARMPSDIAERIDAALAAEALLDASPPQRRGNLVSRETGPSAVSLTGPGAQTPQPSGAPGGPGGEGAPGALRNGDGGGEGGGHDDGRSGRDGADRPRPLSRLRRATTSLGPSVTVSRETGATRPPSRRSGPSGSGPNRPSGRTRRWRSSLMTVVGAIALIGLAGLVINSLGPTKSAPSHGGAGTTADAALKHRVQDLLERTKRPKGSTAGSAAPDVTTKQSPGNANNPMAGSASTLPSCVREGINRTETPLAVDERSPFRGGSGYLVILPHPGGPQRVDAYVIDSSCISHSNAGPAKVLLKRTYPRNARH